MSTDTRTIAIVRRAGLVLLIVILGWAGWTGFKVWQAWDNVDRVAFDPDRARDILASGTDLETGDRSTTTTLDAEDGSGTTSTTTASQTGINRRELMTFLVIGTDSRETGGDSERADVILLVMLPPHTEDVVMVSIPRDLYVDNPCLGSKTKVNAHLNGCGSSISGPELMAIAVEDFTGIAIDHFAVFDFEGFERIIDTVGGVEICVGENAVRDANVGLSFFELPAGCSTANGEMALGWVRSRHTLQEINGRWLRMPGVTDLTRNERQQDLLIAALKELKTVRDINELASLVEDVAGAFTIDDQLSLGDAIGIAWDVRSVALDDIYRPTLEVRFSGTDDGQSILVSVMSFESVLREAYPNADHIFGSDA